MSEKPQQADVDAQAKIVWNYLKMHQPVQKSDCILVLGSADVRVAHRGAELFLQGLAPLIVFSGAVGRLTAGMWDTSEAEVFAQVAMKLGVPKEKMLIENQSTNTGQNIKFSLSLLQKKNLQADKFLLVTKPYMERRAWATFKKLYPQKEVCVTSPLISFEVCPNEVVPKDTMINVMVGDLQRVKLYPEKGFQIYQEIPDEVWSAFERLVAAGYIKYLVA